MDKREDSLAPEAGKQEDNFVPEAGKQEDKHRAVHKHLAVVDIQLRQDIADRCETSVEQGALT